MKAAINILEQGLIPHLPRDLSRIATAARRLSLAFTSERGSLGPDYMADPDSLAAYLIAFLLPNAVKVLHCLGQLDSAGLMPKSGEISVLDLGSGPGTAALAASAFFSAARPNAAVRIAAIDKSGPALERAHELFRGIAPPNHPLESATFDISRQPPGRALAKRRFDIVIAANVLNELPGDSAESMCADLMSNCLADDGSLIIIDPALRETARPLMALRDELLLKVVTAVAAPCLHQGDCPMLKANDRDWCHFYIDWELPEFLKELDRLAAMDHTHLKMSYFILKPMVPSGFFADAQNDIAASHQSPVTSHEPLWRVVSSPLVSKGKREVVLCGEDGTLTRVRRLDKDSSEANSDFDRVARGDIVRTTATDRIRPTDSFHIAKGWISSCGNMQKHS